MSLTLVLASCAISGSGASSSSRSFLAKYGFSVVLSALCGAEVVAECHQHEQVLGMIQGWFSLSGRMLVPGHRDCGCVLMDMSMPLLLMCVCVDVFRGMFTDMVMHLLFSVFVLVHGHVRSRFFFHGSLIKQIGHKLLRFLRKASCSVHIAHKLLGFVYKADRCAPQIPRHDPQKRPGLGSKAHLPINMTKQLEPDDPKATAIPHW